MAIQLTTQERQLLLDLRKAAQAASHLLDEHTPVDVTQLLGELDKFVLPEIRLKKLVRTDDRITLTLVNCTKYPMQSSCGIRVQVSDSGHGSLGFEPVHFKLEGYASIELTITYERIDNMGVSYGSGFGIHLGMGSEHVMQFSPGAYTWPIEVKRERQEV